jgi:hypothetical protein
MVPARTPYDRETLFEHAAMYTKRHGQVRLELNRKEWIVRLLGGEIQNCVSCQRRLDYLCYALGERTLCSQCARRDLR